MRLGRTDNNLFTREQVEKVAVDLTGYQTELARAMMQFDYQRPENSLHLPFDQQIIEKAQAVLDSKGIFRQPPRVIFVVGIGGSNLAAKAVVDSLPRSDRPELVWLDTLDDVQITHAETLIRDQIRTASDYLIFIISKSGATTETLANYAILEALLEREGLEPLSRTIAISNPASVLTKQAEEKEVDTLTIPVQVGGRFSAFSAAGVAVLLAAGYDVAAWRRGAQEWLTKTATARAERNEALLLAASKYLAYENELTVFDQFIFAPELETWGKWYRQLLAESLGKSPENSGNTKVGLLDQSGINVLPTVSIGTTDLHSVGQLYLGGARNIMTTFVITGVEKSAFIPKRISFRLDQVGLEGKSLQEIKRAIIVGTQTAYRDAKRPFDTLELKKLDEYELGVLMQMSMVEIMYLAKLLKVNAFDQPNVEGYKEATRKILAK